jgi:GPH family glycoside/pentoside/hexuronide:cation symporter
MLSASPDTAVLDLRVKVLYGVGELPITMPMVLTGLFLLFFYNTVLGLPAIWVGIGISSGLIADAVIDPYIGFRSDASRHPLGQRHIFMLVGSLAMGVCFYLLFNPPSALRGSALFLWLLLTSIAFRATSAVYRIPYLTLGAELTDDYHERTRVIGIRALFGLAGTLVAAALSFVVFFPSTPGGLDPKLSAENYHQMGISFGLMMSVSGLAAFFGTRSHRRLGTGDASVRWGKFFADFRQAMQRHSFRHIWLSCALFFLAVVLNASLSLQFFTWSARIADSTAISWIQGSFYIGALLGVCILMVASKRLDKRNLFLGNTVVIAALLMAAPFLIGEGKVLGSGSFVALIAGYFIAGVFASAVWVLPSSMLADATDEDDFETGVRREGIFFGILNFGEKVAAGAALLASGALLNFFVHLAPSATTQSPDSVFRLGLAFGLVPGLVLLAACAAILPYRLNSVAVARIQQSIRMRREGLGNGR